MPASRACLLASAVAVLMISATAGCSLLQAKVSSPTSLYRLDGPGSEAGGQSVAGPSASSGLLTLVVEPPGAAPGLDSNRMAYSLEAHRMQYYARSEWTDAPARMLAPLLRAAISRGGKFAAVVLAPSDAVGELRLDTEVLRLEQDFAAGAASRVRFTLRATLVDNTTHRVVGWREFDQTVAAASDDPYGGVVAANQAVQAALEQLAAFCNEHAR
jgi:cholesterol transport system auxiliary component